MGQNRLERQIDGEVWYKLPIDIFLLVKYAKRFAPKQRILFVYWLMRSCPKHG